MLVGSLSLAFLVASGLMAQEVTELTIQVKKDGKVVKDTTYQFEDEAEANHAMKMMELMTGDKEDLEKIQYISRTSEGEGTKTMVFISEDGENTVIKKMHGDSLMWMEEGDHPHEAHVKEEHVIVMKSDDGDTFDVLIDEDSEGHDGVKKKEIRVVVSGDEEGSWTVDSDELEEVEEVEEDVYVIQGDDVQGELKEILKEYDGKEGSKVKVIVIKKSNK